MCANQQLCIMYYPGPDKITRANRDDWPITRKELGDPSVRARARDGTQLCSKDLRPLLPRSQDFETFC